MIKFDEEILKDMKYSFQSEKEKAPLINGINLCIDLQ